MSITYRAGGRSCAALAFAGVLAAACGAAHAEVAITGLDDAQRANVLAYLDLDEEPCDAPAWRVEQRYLGAPEKIDSALQALGFYEARVKPSIERDDKCWHAKFDVQPGLPVMVRGFDVQLSGEAANDSLFVALRQQSPMRSGVVLHHGDYESLKRSWSDLASERGYADAKFTESRIDVYPDQRVADIVLKFDSGRRYHFGEVKFHQDVLSESLIASYLKIRRGNPYDSRELTTLYTTLADSGYFRNIEVRPLDANRETAEIPVDIFLTGAPRRQINYGLGYSTDTGPRFRFSRNNRRFNEHGHQFGYAVQVSPVISEVAANYRMPFGDPRTDWLNFDAGVKHEDTETSVSDSLQLGVRRVQREQHDWVRTQYLSLLVEDFEVGEQLGRSRLLMPGIDWRRVRADNPLLPRKGTRLELEARAAADKLGSDTDFVQLILHGKWIWAFGEKSRFLLRSDLGATEEKSFDELPPSVRFFAGGDNSVRGYDFETLGPADANGKVIGGSSLAVASVEYERKVIGPWSVAVFLDSGNAFESSHFEPKTGAGLGARWQSPLGPIRLDVAHPVHDPAEGWRLHITLGPDL